ncbi:hypothetical protein BJP40_06790 [Streptomyces sp. CC53]|uniref:transglycosylase SLT domain-containing protein n=1 Tax=Streptomyces sp. CC53 TaxID=1906740 RepID=UPI0008DD6347|nr:transglycosylase SLT domain-containing protein [Streptomyces sp. CC53]OII61228.1 hypothetical protein BJP40_06790 [Streptomyces sp. CC53]
MTAIRDVQIALLAAEAGIPDEELATAVAICLGESSGQPRAYNGHGGDHSFGLWQINMRGRMGPARRAQYGISSNEALFDPVVNAKAMARLSSGGRNWKPWGAYTKGGYRNKGRLERAEEAVHRLRSGEAVEPPIEAPAWHPTVNAAHIYPGGRGHSVYVLQRALAAMFPDYRVLSYPDRRGVMDEESVAFLNRWMASGPGGSWPATGYANLDTLSRLGYKVPPSLEFKATCDHVDADEMHFYGGS